MGIIIPVLESKPRNGHEIGFQKGINAKIAFLKAAGHSLMFETRRLPNPSSTIFNITVTSTYKK